MIRRLLLASIITLGSTCTLITSANAQTTNPELNQLLQQSDQLIREADSEIRNNIAPAGQQYQNYLQQLTSACANGNNFACNEYEVRMQQQRQHLDNIQRQQNSYYNQDWIDSFGR